MVRKILILSTLLAIGAVALAQKSPTPQSLNKELEEMVLEVSADSIRSYVEKMVSFGTRHSLSDTTRDDVGIGAARRWVASKFSEFGKRNNVPLNVILDPYELKPGPRASRIPYPVTMKNVLGTLPGSDKNDNRVILVSGHLDSRNSDVMDSVNLAPGANDDASGVAVVIELARIMSKKRFPCTLIFMAVQGEEQGLVGARHMAGKLKQENVNLIAMFNNDIVGNSIASETGNKNDKTVRIFSEMIPSLETSDETSARNALKSENDSPSRQLARYIKEVSEPYLKGFTATLNARPDRFLRGGDHTPFNQLGFTAVRFCEFNENFTQQHQNIREENGVKYGDLPEFVDYEYIANVTRMNLVGMSLLAKAPAMPNNVKMKINLGNITNLSWEAPTGGPAVKGYNVLLRETYEPFWSKKVFVEGTTAELPYSKDNYFFAVQSVGKDGSLSQIVMPVPSR